MIIIWLVMLLALQVLDDLEHAPGDAREADRAVLLFARLLLFRSTCRPKRRDYIAVLLLGREEAEKEQKPARRKQFVLVDNVISRS